MASSVTTENLSVGTKADWSFDASGTALRMEFDIR